jgi:hypothetical protein
MGDVMKVILVCLTIVVVAILVGSVYEPEIVKPDQKVTATEFVSVDKHQPSQPSDTILKNLADQFMARLVQDIDQENKVKNFHTKKELIQYLSEISNEKLAKLFIDYYYYEADGDLYIVPTETPPWFMKKNSYIITEISPTKYQLKQTNEVDLYGTYTIVLEYIYSNNKWRIEDVKYE